MPFFLLLAGLFLLARSSSSSSSDTPAPSGGDGSFYMTCEEAIEHLPADMRFAIATAIYTGTDAKALLELANALEVASSAQSDIYLRAALLVAAHCARDRAVAISSGAPMPSPLIPPSPAPLSSTAGAPSSSSLAGDGTAPASTADGSAPIFGRVDTTESAARVGRTYAVSSAMDLGKNL